MQPTKLVIASILKPVDDTRMYEKFAKTLVQTKKYEINIIGFWSKKSPAISNIIQHPIFKFKRLSIRRWFASILYYRVLIKLKPAILIVTTHELLPASIVYKAFYPSRVIYDVRENYYRNIKYLNTYPAIVKDLLAIWVRCKETLAARFIDHFI